MTQKYDNDKNFLIIQIDLIDALIVCGVGGICDSCNNEINPFEKDGFGDVYYIAVINRVLCKRCCDDFIKGYDKHPEDESFEIQHYNYYAKKLNLKTYTINDNININDISDSNAKEIFEDLEADYWIEEHKNNPI